MSAWRIGFVPCAAHRKTWWERLMRPGYHHLWASRRVSRNCWLWVEWTRERLIVGIVGAAFVRRASAAAHEVVAYAPGFRLRRRAIAFPVPSLIYCVTVAADLTSVAVLPWATPWGFRCALLRKGGKPLRRLEAAEAGL